MKTGLSIHIGIKQLSSKLLMTLAVLFSQVTYADVSESSVIITSSRGQITYADPTGNSHPLKSFAKIYTGSMIQLNNNSNLQLVYIHGGLQENWQGPAQFTIGKEHSIPLQAEHKPTSKRLPEHMLKLLDNSPLVVSDIKTRQGMIRLRSLETALKIKKAQQEYNELLKTSNPDDITPELLLITKLDALMAYHQMKAPLESMRKKQPENLEVESLYKYYMQNSN